MCRERCIATLAALTKVSIADTDVCLLLLPACRAAYLAAWLLCTCLPCLAGAYAGDA
jgi:hypothetical protein